MTPTNVERVYEALAETIDEVGAEKSELYLSKLALLLAYEIGDAESVLGLIESAREHLEA